MCQLTSDSCGCCCTGGAAAVEEVATSGPTVPQPRRHAAALRPLSFKIGAADLGAPQRTRRDRQSRALPAPAWTPPHQMRR